MSTDKVNIQELAKIGGTLECYHDYITIPCSVQNTSGQRHDKAIVLVSKQPPYFWYKPQWVHWANEIASISASPFALPFDVRKASFAKDEISMGFAPTGVIDNNQNQYVLGCGSHFIDANHAKGENIRLSEYQGSWREDERAGLEGSLLIWLLAVIVEQGKSLFNRHERLPKRPKTIWPAPAEAYYFVDWFDGCERLLTSP